MVCIVIPNYLNTDLINVFMSSNSNMVRKTVDHVTERLFYV